MTTYYFIRHGVTDWIESGFIQGISDRPLSSFGLEQAKLTGMAFKNTKASRLYVSPMKRAVQTAQPVSAAIGLEPEIIEGLQEKDQGWFEGKRDMWRRLSGNKVLLAIWRPIFQLISSLTGEKYSAFQSKVLEAWKYIRSQKADRAVIVVAHSGVLKAILMHELGKDMKKTRRYFSNTCSITEINIDTQGCANLVSFNKTSHLKDKNWT